jgi:hypothetical protein
MSAQEAFDHLGKLLEARLERFDGLCGSLPHWNNPTAAAVDAYVENAVQANLYWSLRSDRFFWRGDRGGEEDAESQGDGSSQVPAGRGMRNEDVVDVKPKFSFSTASCQYFIVQPKIMTTMIFAASTQICCVPSKQGKSHSSQSNEGCSCNNSPNKSSQSASNPSPVKSSRSHWIEKPIASAASERKGRHNLCSFSNGTLELCSSAKYSTNSFMSWKSSALPVMMTTWQNRTK